MIVWIVRRWYPVAEAVQADCSTAMDQRWENSGHRTGCVISWPSMFDCQQTTEDGSQQQLPVYIRQLSTQERCQPTNDRQGCGLAASEADVGLALWWGVQVKLWYSLRMCPIPESLEVCHNKALYKATFTLPYLTISVHVAVFRTYTVREAL